MLDYQLDSCGDLNIANSDIQLISGKAQTLQACLVFLRTNLTEFFYDQELGIPWIQELFEKGATVSKVNGYIRRGLTSIFGVENVVEILYRNYNARERIVDIQISLKLVGEENIETLIYRGDNGSIDCSLDYWLPRLYTGLNVWIDIPIAGFENQAKEFAIGNATAQSTDPNVPPKIDNPTGLSVSRKALKLYNLYYANNHACVYLEDTPYLPASSSYTAFFVVAPIEKALYEDSQIGLFSLYGLDTAGNPLVDGLFINVNTNPITFVFQQATTGESANNYAFDAVLYYNSPRLLVLKIDKIEGSITLLENEVVLGAEESLIDMDTRLTDGTIALGASYDLSKTLTTFLHGNIGEFLLYQNLLSDYDTYAIIKYLRTKWSI